MPFIICDRCNILHARIFPVLIFLQYNLTLIIIWYQGRHLDFSSPIVPISLHEWLDAWSMEYARSDKNGTVIHESL